MNESVLRAFGLEIRVDALKRRCRQARGNTYCAAMPLENPVGLAIVLPKYAHSIRHDVL